MFRSVSPLWDSSRLSSLSFRSDCVATVQPEGALLPLFCDALRCWSVNSVQSLTRPHPGIQALAVLTRTVSRVTDLIRGSKSLFTPDY
jgi:hypothetical protein